MTTQITPELLQSAKDILQRKLKEEGIPKEVHKKISTVSSILHFMYESEDNWREFCPFNYGYIESSFAKSLNRITQQEQEIWEMEYFDSILMMSIRFLRESMLSQQRKLTYSYSDSWDSFEYQEIWNWFKKLPVEEISFNSQGQYEYIKNELPIALLNHYLGDKSFRAFLNFEENINKAEQERQKCETNIQKEIDRADAKITEVQRLESSLKTYKEGFNFVGLANGFSNLLVKKENNKNCMFWLLFLIGFFIVATPFIKMLSETNWANITWQQLLIGIGLEFVLIYFFRVVLNQYRAVETQIMQLELRLSLCQFIQAYVDYAKDIKATDKEALDKFENLIFSSILSNDNNIPSTFDGMEQVTQLIKELKSKP
ncbi:hypothetical protein ACKLNO_04045 [Neisseriaceae bacterium B1]